MTTALPMRPPPSAPRNTAPLPVTANAAAMEFYMPPESASLPPPKLILNAVEGWGKTSTGAYAPSPLMIMAPHETGYETLYGAGRAPRLPCVKPKTFADLLAVCDRLVSNPSGIKTAFFDALGGFERLCHEQVCKAEFKGDWGEKGFTSYQRGYDISLSTWLQFVQRWDDLVGAGINVVIASHSRIRPFPNPLGADFSRYVADCHQKTWDICGKYADAVLFGNYVTVIDERDGKRKGIGGTSRVLYTERRDAFDAKNRYGMPEALDIPDDPSKVWDTINNAITGKESA